MKGIAIILVMLGTLAMEWILAAAIPGAGVFVPITALVFCYVSWRMKFEALIWFAFLIGYSMDAVKLVFPGTYVLTFMAIALLSEAFKIFFSNTESKAAQAISIGLLMAAFFAAVPILTAILGQIIS